MRCFVIFILAALIQLSCSSEQKKKKKDLTSYTEAELEQLYDQWEDNDEDELDEDELPPHKQKHKKLDLEEMKAKAKNPEDMLRMSKKGQTVMMFVNVIDPSQPGKSDIRQFTEDMTSRWQSMLYNNHVDLQVFVIEPNRAIMMFKDGAQAFEAKDLLIKQKEVVEIDMEEDALAAAISQVAGLLQRPDQLEKLPEMRKRADRKKAAVEAMLRTGVQSQLEGIRTAIAHLHAASDDINAIDNGIAAIRTRLKPFPELKEKMRELRHANARHGQYAAAMENLKHIFNINNTIQETRDALDQGKLLVAHKNIMDLELARDELLAEVHKMPSTTKEADKNQLVTFFLKVDHLVSELGKNMWFIIGRALEMVRGGESGSGPVELVSALRIVEREERIDQYYLDRRKRGNDFMPPGRPREWRKKTFEVLEKTVWSRVEGNQLDDRLGNKAWLARYLEVCRRVIVDDLMVARAAAPCFPPDCQIYDRFVHMYHNCICKRIREIASDKLEKSELVQLMSWIQAYGGEELLGNRRLQINAPAMLQDMPLLTRTMLNDLCDSFVEMTRGDMEKWLGKTLDAEKDDWYKDLRPEEDNFRYFYTSLPNILFGMLRDTVTLAKEVNVEVIPSVINVTMEGFYEFATKYKDAFIAYRDKCFEDRARFPNYTKTMIAIANNLHTCIESTDRYMQQVRLSMENDEGSTTRRGASRQQIIDNIDKLNSKWNQAVSVAVSSLQDEVCRDLVEHLDTLLSKKWLIGCGAMDTICLTLRDYYEDHIHLRPSARLALLMDLQFRIVGEYFRAVDARRLTFQSWEERRDAENRMKKDAEAMENLFRELASVADMNEQIPALTPVITAAGGVIGLKDKSLLSLEATSFGRKFPNIPAELLASLLVTREDMSRSDAKLLSEEVIEHVKFHPKDDLFGQLFASCQGGNTGWRPNIDVANVLSSFMKKTE